MISPEKKTIEEILKGSGVKYSVPTYQRNFDWGKGELQELLDDIIEISKNDKKELFLGNFIFDISNKSNYLIVDGQQRLTTISLIFIAIREHAKKLNEERTTAEVQNFIAEYSDVRETNEEKISVSENIKDIFKYMSNIDWEGDFPDKINEKGIKRQVNKVKPIFGDIMVCFEKYNIKQLKSFIRTIWDSYVIVLKVENDEDVFSIFERTNARGLDLNIGDLLKNYIFSHNIKEHEYKWNEIVLNAEGSFQRMLKYYWVSRKGHILQSALYKELKKYGKELGIDLFVKDLYEFSRYYKTVQSLDEKAVYNWLIENECEELSGNEDYYKSITRVFHGLKFFRVTQTLPLIFSIFHNYKQSSANNVKQLLNVLSTFEKYHFVNNVISGRTGNEIEMAYASKAMEFYENKEKKGFQQLCGEILNTLKLKKALKDEFTSNFIESVTYSKKNIQMINYVFDRINNYDVKGGQYIDIFTPEKDIQKRNFNIEHFLAQNKKSEYKEEELDAFDKVGNLLVISRHTNSQLQDKNPEEKVSIMKSDLKHFGNLRYISDFFEKYDKDFESWNLNSINKRSEEIAIHAYNNIWNF